MQILISWSKVGAKMLEASKVVHSTSSPSSSSSIDVYFNVAIRAILKSVRTTLDTRTNDVASLTVGMVYALGTLISILDSDGNDDDGDNQVYLLTRFLSTKGVPLVSLTPSLFAKLVIKTVGTFVVSDKSSSGNDADLLKGVWNMINPNTKLLSLPSLLSCMKAINPLHQHLSLDLDINTTTTTTTCLSLSITLLALSLITNEFIHSTSSSEVEKGLYDMISKDPSDICNSFLSDLIASKNHTSTSNDLWIGRYQAVCSTLLFNLFQPAYQGVIISSSQIPLFLTKSTSPSSSKLLLSFIETHQRNIIRYITKGYVLSFYYY